MILDFEVPDESPDPKLQAALESVLPVRNREAFRARVLARTAGYHPRRLTTLERWARPALAAAATVALAAWVAGGLLDTSTGDALTLDSVMVSAATGSTPAAFIAAPRPPDPETVFGSLGTP
ncbi:MAG TPA: hypothetical protein VNX15_07130 [Gemmatimonadales bacterium]|jgi:hypothetical protein|nr:hypothetical protein [Gemmatimonadales bacterium]